MRSSSPTWVVFEGIDGSGKTTQAKLLDEYLTGIGVKSRYRHVFDSAAGRMLREMFLENAFSNTVEILVLCATRQAFFDTLEDDDCDVLIVDRFFLSILAMQGRTPEDVEMIRFAQDRICGPGPGPVVYYLNTSPEVCHERLVRKGGRDRIEEKGVEFHRSVANRYTALLRGEREVHRFDGQRDIVEIHKSIVATTLALLGGTAPDAPPVWGQA